LGSILLDALESHPMIVNYFNLSLDKEGLKIYQKGGVTRFSFSYEPREKREFYDLSGG